jgi:hypothetical protein
MQTQRRQLARRLADAADLLIDFATLGEYGLEPVAEPPRCRPGRRRAARLPDPEHARGSMHLARAGR